MKKNLFDTLLDAAINLVLPFFLCYCAIASFATAFELPLSSGTFAGLLLAVCACAGAVCLVPGRELRFILSLVFLCLGGAVIFYNLPVLNQSLRLIYTAFTSLVGPPYGLSFADWAPQRNVLATASPGLVLWGCLLGAVTVPALYRRDSLFPVLLLDSLPLGLCMVLVDTTPRLSWCLGYVVCALLLMLSQHSRRTGLDGSRLIALLVLPCVLLVQGLCILVPPDNYSRKDSGQNLLQLLLNSAARISEVEINDMGGLDVRVPVSETENLNIGPRHNPQTKMMRVRTYRTGPLYLRGTAYCTYTGSSWELLEDEAYDGIPRASAEGLFLHDADAVPEQYAVDIRTTIAQPQIYLPGLCQAVRDLGSPRQDILLENRDNLREYTLIYGVLDLHPAFWGADGDTAYEGLVRTEYMALPEDTRASALEIAEQWGLDERSAPWDIVDAVRRCADYSLDTQRMPRGADFAIWFLQESETGYCVHFASAATVMLRALGYPARYVTGYLAGAQRDRWVNVTAQSAHAWVEVYQPDLGWVPFEATPAVGVELTVNPAPPTTSPTRPATTPTQPKPTEAPATQPTKPTSGGVTGPEKVTVRVTFPVKGIALCALALGLFFLRRPAVRRLRRISRRGKSRDSYLRRWRACCKLARALGLPSQLEQEALKARFGGKPMAESDWQALKDWHRELQKALAAAPKLRRFWIQWCIIAD